MFDHKGLTAMEAKRRAMSKPGEAKSSAGMTRPHDQEQPGGDNGGDDAGDGMHHHELHGPDETGGYTSMHTHPDGRKEPGDHADYADAKEHMDRMHGEDHDGEEDDGHDGMSHEEPDGDEPEDIASMYDQG